VQTQYCTELYSNVMYCAVLYCTVLYNTVLFEKTWKCIPGTVALGRVARGTPLEAQGCPGGRGVWGRAGHPHLFH